MDVKPVKPTPVIRPTRKVEHEQGKRDKGKGTPDKKSGDEDETGGAADHIDTYA